MAETYSHKEQLERLLRSLSFDMRSPLSTCINSATLMREILPEWQLEKDNFIYYAEITQRSLQLIIDLIQIYLDGAKTQVNVIDITQEPSMSDTPLQIRAYIAMRVHHQFTLLHQQATNISNLTSAIDQKATCNTLIVLLEILVQNTKEVQALLDHFRNKYSYTRKKTSL